jgi:hypothetical protein
MNKIVIALLTSSILISTTIQAGIGYAGQDNYGPSIHLLSANSDSVILEFRSPAYQLEQVNYGSQIYTQIDVPGLSETGEPGKPKLPVSSTLIGLPPTAKYELRILTDVTEVVVGRYFISPAGTPVVGDEDLQPGKFVYVPDRSAYQTDANYPDEQVRIGDEAWLRDHRLARVDFYPFQYNPAQASLVWHKYMRVEVRFLSEGRSTQTPIMQLAGPTGSVSGSNNPFDQVLRTQLINYNAAKDWRGIPYSQLPTVPDGRDSMLSSEPRYKISVKEDGIYKVSYEELLAAGMDVGNIDPTTFEMTNQGRPAAIFVSNIGNEHTFEAGEYILFYGQKLDGSYLASLYPDEDDHWRTNFYYPDGIPVNWSPHFNSLMVEKYTDTNVYWLTTTGSPGLRMNEIDGAPGGAPTPTSYRATVRAEQSHKWKTTHFTNEDTWFWEELKTSLPSLLITKTYTTTITAPATGIYTTTLRGEIVAVTSNDIKDPILYPDHHTKIFINKSINPSSLVDSTWDGQIRYHYESGLSQSFLISGTNALELDIYRTTFMISEDLLFDWFEIEYDRQFQALNNEIEFSINQAGNWNYALNGFSESDIKVFDVTNPLSPTIIISSTYSAGTVTYQITQGSTAHFFAGKVRIIDHTQLSKYIPPDFSQPADYVFITHHDFLTETRSLANYRESQGLSTLVVDINDLYNEYNFGIYHPIAIRNFLKDTLVKWGSLPLYVLIIGDGHWNFKGYVGTITEPLDSPPIYIPPNLEWVDPWQGEVDSANQYATLIGDDPLPDVMIGRLPVNNTSQLNSIINKIIAHESTSGQDWQKRFVFVADNPDGGGDFVSYSEKIIGDYHLAPIYVPERIYLSTYLNSGTCGTVYGRHSCPAATQALTQTLNTNGALVLNYSGHASVNIWAGEGILANEDISSLSNGNRLPMLLSLDCLDGYWIHPNSQGLVEELLRADNKGIVTAFSPTGLGISAGHDDLQRGFYDTMFQGMNWTFGEAALSAKTLLYARHPAFVDLIYTYTIFGDPALRSGGLVRNLLFLPVLNK